MTAPSTDWLVLLGHPDHLVVCRALREIAVADHPSAAVLERTLALTASPMPAVERSALRALATLGARAEGIADALLRQLARRLGDGGGCHFDCCGYAAYYAPVAEYIAALLAVAGAERLLATLDRNDLGLDAAEVDEIRMLLAAFR